MSSFKIDNPSLLEMLQLVKSGKVQLPEFQRDWRWNDEHIRNLIISVSQSFPIGVIMTLKIGNAGLLFQTRPIEGTDPSVNRKDPESIILDGQQRLTALFQSLITEEPVKTSNNLAGTGLYYYLDMSKCVEGNADYEETILAYKDSLPPETTYDECKFPLHKIFDSVGWRRDFTDFWRREENKTKLDKMRDLWDEFEEKIIDVFKGYQIPVIELNDETPKEAICQIFEKVNQQGIELNVFELLTASLAAEDFELRKDWSIREERLKENSVLQNLENVNFLQVLTLLCTKSRNSGVSCKRREILGLKRRDYQEFADRVEEGFELAARFLHEQKIFNAQDLPYNGQLVPLAAILADLKDARRSMIEDRKKLAQWYWCGVFGEMYSASTDTRFANDLSEVTSWIKGLKDQPRTIREANFHENRLLELRTRNSAPYKGVYAILMRREGCRDFYSGDTIELQTFFRDNIDIHHIFPKAWCDRQNIEQDDYNSIINKTALSSRTNQKIGKKPPSQYLLEIQEDTGIETSKMNEILVSHLIPANLLLTDNFRDFYNKRKEELLNAIEKTMGKPAIREAEDRQNTSEY